MGAIIFRSADLDFCGELVGEEDGLAVGVMARDDAVGRGEWWGIEGHGEVLKTKAMLD